MIRNTGSLLRGFRGSRSPFFALSLALGLALLCCRQATAEDGGDTGAGAKQCSVVYGMIPALHGGLRSSIKQLDKVREMGADMIWLSPVTDSPKRDFGYAVLDLNRIKKSLGSKQDLKNFVSAAHEKGIRVILDMAVNHLSEESEPYKEHRKDFFDQDAKGEATNYFDWKNLKNLNYKNYEVRAYIERALDAWIVETDVDGFRMDAAWAIKQRSPDFWSECITRLKMKKPGLFMLAEASALDDYYAEVGFTSAYDWNEQIGQWAWKNAFETDSGVATSLRQSIKASLAAKTAVFRFLDNNDTGKRFLDQHGEPMTKLAMAMLMTLPGVPCVYMGEESNIDYQPYDYDTALRTWQKHDSASNTSDIGKFLEKLIEIRKSNTEIGTSKNLIFLSTAQDDALLAYERPGKECITVLLNFSDKPISINLTRYLRHFDAMNLLTNESIMLTERETLIPPFGSLILGSREQPKDTNFGSVQESNGQDTVPNSDGNK